MGDQHTMKLVSAFTIAFCAAVVVALPADNVVPETPEASLMEASYADAKDTITALLQQGKDDSACRDMAKATADEVKAAVAAQQKALAAMPNGDECDDEGQGLIDKANQDKMDADKAKNDAQTALTAARKDKFNFGDFAYEDLTEGQCGTFFNSGVWKNAKSKVNAAQSTYNTKAAEATAAAKAVETAKEEAKRLVQECKCKAKQALDTALKNMNDSAKDANQKAWNKSYHMQCVLDGKTTNNCNVPSLPVVTPVPYGKDVEHACGCNRPPFHGDKCKPPHPNPNGQYTFFGQNANNWGSSGDREVESTVWHCGSGMSGNKKQEFMLSRIYIGSRLPQASDYQRCYSEDGWRPLCDYKGACNGGVAKEGVFPDQCPNYVHNNQFFNAIKHKGGSSTTAWQNYGYSDWTNSLRYVAGFRNDGSSYGYGACTYPRSNWCSGDPNSIMCILPLHGCKKGECGFTG